MLDPIFYDDRLTVAVPQDFGTAVRAAARQNDLTVADYARTALADRLENDGIPFERPYLLHRLPGRPDGGFDPLG